MEENGPKICGGLWFVSGVEIAASFTEAMCVARYGLCCGQGLMRDAAFAAIGVNFPVYPAATVL
ncbi:MAG: hypothetical protein ACM3WV_10840 [Bacillota bacterium]